MGIQPLAAAIFSVDERGETPATPMGGCGFW